MSILVLIVEDEPLLGRNLKIFLERQGFEALLAPSVREAMSTYQAQNPDIILVDHNLPDGTGLNFIADVRRNDRYTKLVMVTAHGGVDLAVAAMKAGADDYLTKPVSLDEMALLVGKLAAQARLEGSYRTLSERGSPPGGIDRIIGMSPGIAALKRRIRAVAQAELQQQKETECPGPTVLILGETGTGKELVARALHSLGPRHQSPFIGINCAALPEHLVESELFGHERGAFTGADERKVGLFQAADGGTLFLDEIGELPLPLQAKLLKAIEDMTIRPVGSTRDRKINVRFVAATNALIEERARSGEFRADLLYRLNTVTLDIPPLRNRGDDILLIAESFVSEFQRRYGRAKLLLTPEARQALLRHPWPGNIRQLRNVIEQACLLCARDRIEVEDLNLRDIAAIRAIEPQPGYHPAQPAAGGPAGQHPAPNRGGLVDVERQLIIDALRAQAGNVSLAARVLGVSRDTLRYRMEKYELRREDYV